VAADHGFEFWPLRSLENAIDLQVYAELSRKSNFYNEFCGYIDLRDRCFAPLFEQIEPVGKELCSLVARLSADRPALLLADSHMFSDYYRMLAATIGARLVLHRVTGSSLYPFHRPFVRCYGLSNCPGWTQRAVELAGALNVRVLRGWRALRYPDRRRATRARHMALEEAARRVFGDARPRGPEPQYIASGICVLEARVAVPKLTGALQDEIHLPPGIEHRSAPLPEQIDAWLAHQSRPIVYVSFGTLVAPEQRVLRNLSRGLSDADVAVLWAQPHAQRACLDDEGLSTDRFHFENFVPQAALLASGRISCFVTHAGSGSVQESLISAVPMLCIPFVSDQPYIASVMVRLGVALRLSRRRLRHGDVRAAVAELLDNPVYAARARALAAELRCLQEAEESAAWVDRLFNPVRC
jgi:hypothetical protein